MATVSLILFLALTATKLVAGVVYYRRRRKPRVVRKRAPLVDIRRDLAAA